MSSLHTAASLALPPGTFSTRHILLTAALTAVLTLVAAATLRVRGADLAVTTVLAFAATWLLRRAANLPQLNDDGLPGFSANDVLSPVATWVALALFSDIQGHSPGTPIRRARAAAALLAFAVNVLTI